MKKDENRMFPLFVDLHEKPVLVVGAGHIAGRRIQTLMRFGAKLSVVAPEISSEIVSLADSGGICLIKKKYECSDILGMKLVLAATDNRELNAQIGMDCRAQGIPVNVCSDRELCDFHFPGIVLEEELTVGINASGRNHHKAKEARIAIENFLQEAKL